MNEKEEEIANENTSETAAVAVTPQSRNTRVSETTKAVEPPRKTL